MAREVVESNSKGQKDGTFYTDVQSLAKVSNTEMQR